MNIYIISRGRAGKVNTLKWIPKVWRERTFIVHGHSEVMEYSSHYPREMLIQAPRKVTNYSQKLQWIMDGLPEFRTGMGAEGLSYTETVDTYPKCLIMDDDLVFSSRSSVEKPDSLISIKDPELLAPMYEQIANMLDEYALVGVHPRQMGQHAARPYVMNGRIICIQGINRAKINAVGPVKVDQFPILADVVLNCTLLARGQANAIVTTFFQDHGPCQAAGGCSIYRTHEMQRTAVEYLANRFPGFVKVVERITKDKWLANEDGVRYDYTCRWKDLYAAGLDCARGLRGCPDREMSK